MAVRKKAKKAKTVKAKVVLQRDSSAKLVKAIRAFSKRVDILLCKELNRLLKSLKL